MSLLHFISHWCMPRLLLGNVVSVRWLWYLSLYPASSLYLSVPHFIFLGLFVPPFLPLPSSFFALPHLLIFYSTGWTCPLMDASNLLWQCNNAMFSVQGSLRRGYNNEASFLDLTIDLTQTHAIYWNGLLVTGLPDTCWYDNSLHFPWPENLPCEGY